MSKSLELLLKAKTQNPGPNPGYLLNPDDKLAGKSPRSPVSHLKEVAKTLEGVYKTADNVHVARTNVLPWQHDTEGKLYSTEEEQRDFQMRAVAKYLDLGIDDECRLIELPTKPSNVLFNYIKVAATKEKLKDAAATMLLQYWAEKQLEVVEKSFRKDLCEWIEGRGKESEYVDTWWVQKPSDRSKIKTEFTDINTGIISDEEKMKLRKNAFLDRLRKTFPTNDEMAYLWYKYIIKKHDVPIQYLLESPPDIMDFEETVVNPEPQVREIIKEVTIDDPKVPELSQKLQNLALELQSKNKILSDLESKLTSERNSYSETMKKNELRTQLLETEKQQKEFEANRILEEKEKALSASTMTLTTNEKALRNLKENEEKQKEKCKVEIHQVHAETNNMIAEGKIENVSENITQLTEAISNVNENPCDALLKLISVRSRLLSDKHHKEVNEMKKTLNSNNTTLNDKLNIINHLESKVAEITSELAVSKNRNLQYSVDVEELQKTKQQIELYKQNLFQKDNEIVTLSGEANNTFQNMQQMIAKQNMEVEQLKKELNSTKKALNKQNNRSLGQSSSSLTSRRKSTSKTLTSPVKKIEQVSSQPVIESLSSNAEPFQEEFMNEEYEYNNSDEEFGNELDEDMKAFDNPTKIQVISRRALKREAESFGKLKQEDLDNMLVDSNSKGTMNGFDYQGKTERRSQYNESVKRAIPNKYYAAFAEKGISGLRSTDFKNDNLAQKLIEKRIISHIMDSKQNPEEREEVIHFWVPLSEAYEKILDKKIKYPNK